jgi:hypothetical protein
MNPHLRERGAYDPYPDHLPRPDYHHRHQGPRSRIGVTVSVLLTAGVVIFLVAAIVTGAHP